MLTFDLCLEIPQKQQTGKVAFITLLDSVFQKAVSYSSVNQFRYFYIKVERGLNLKNIINFKCFTFIFYKIQLLKEFFETIK